MYNIRTRNKNSTSTHQQFSETASTCDDWLASFFKMDALNSSLDDGNSSFPQHEKELLDSSDITLESLVPIWSKNVLIVFIAIAIILGIPGNSLVLVILLKIKRKTSTDMFVIFIAFCDIISLAFNGTVYIRTFTSDLSDSLSSQYLCKVHMYLVHMVFLQSTFLITCVGIDRYFKTCRPHSVLFTAKSSFICCIILTVISALFSSSHMFTTKLNEYGKCILDNSMASLRFKMYAALFIIVLCCSVSLCVMYSKIAVQIRRRVRVSPAMASYIQTYRERNHHNPDRSVFSQSKPKEDGNDMHNEGARMYHLRTSEAQIGVRTLSGKVSLMSRSGFHSLRKKTKFTVQTVFASSSSRESRLGTFSKSDRATEGPSSLPEVDPRVQDAQRMRETQLHMDRMSRQVNKTTTVMAAITCVFIVSTVIPSLSVAILTGLNQVKHHEVGRIIVFFVLRIYIVNNFANPVFYIWLSSAFRKKVKSIFGVCKCYPLK